MKFALLTAGLMLIHLSIADASDGHHKHGKHSDFAGMENRPIKSLSAADIEELQRGGGWGLAKAAELNGVPGPIHLLELRDQIPLSRNQVTQITEVYHDMKERATRLGLQLIEHERELEEHFQNRTIDEDILRDSLSRISSVRENLRYTHLSAHLMTPSILSEGQIQEYNKLRGYDTISRCDQVPEGHNPVMWRKHHGCE